MSDTAKKVLLVIAGLLVVAATYFFVFQPNTDEVTSLEAESNKLQNEVNRLNALQAQIAQIEPQAEQHEAEMDMYFAEYPSRMTEQKAIYNVYRMMVDTGLRVTTLQPSKDMTFMQSGHLVTDGKAVLSENTEDPLGAGASAEVSPETKVPINEIIGKHTSYQMAIVGKKSEVMDALDWISTNNEHMSVGNLALSFDSSTGKLTGTIEIIFYSMNGNGIAYVEPDVSGIVIGTDDIFGTGEKKSKDTKRTYQDPKEITLAQPGGKNTTEGDEEE